MKRGICILEKIHRVSRKIIIVVSFIAVMRVIKLIVRGISVVVGMSNWVVVSQTKIAVRRIGLNRTLG